MVTNTSIMKHALGFTFEIRPPVHLPLPPSPLPSATNALNGQPLLK